MKIELLDKATVLKIFYKIYRYVLGITALIDFVITIISWVFKPSMATEMQIYVLGITSITLFILFLMYKNTISLESFYIGKASITGVISYAMRSRRRRAHNNIDISNATTIYTIGERNTTGISTLTVEWNFNCSLTPFNNNINYSMLVSTTAGTKLDRSNVKCSICYDNINQNVNYTLKEITDLTYILTLSLPNTNYNCIASCTINVAQSFQFDWNQSEVFIVDPRNYSNNVSSVAVSIFSREKEFASRKHLVYKVNRNNYHRRELNGEEVKETIDVQTNGVRIIESINLKQTNYSNDNEFFIIANMHPKDID